LRAEKVCLAGVLQALGLTLAEGRLPTAPPRLKRSFEKTV